MTPDDFRAARLSLGLTAKQAAPLFGLSHGRAIYKIEMGDTVPAWHVILMRLYLQGCKLA